MPDNDFNKDGIYLGSDFAREKIMPEINFNGGGI